MEKKKKTLIPRRRKLAETRYHLFMSCFGIRFFDLLRSLLATVLEFLLGYRILSEEILKQNVGTELSNKFVFPSLVYIYVGKYYANYLKYIKIYIFNFLMKDIFIEI